MANRRAEASDLLYSMRRAGKRRNAGAGQGGRRRTRIMQIDTAFEHGLGGPLRGLHPLVKLLAAVVLCVSAFTFRPWQVPAALALGDRKSVV